MQNVDATWKDSVRAVRTARLEALRSELQFLSETLADQKLAYNRILGRVELIQRVLWDLEKESQ